MTSLYLTGYCSSDGKICLPAESASILFVLTFCKNKLYDVTLVNCFESPSSTLSPCVIQIPSEKIKTEFDLQCSDFKDIPEVIQQCQLPAIGVRNHKKILSGVGGVARNIIITASKQEGNCTSRKLLGHKEVCLKACAEVSSWTKFCEVEFPGLVNGVLHLIHNEFSVADELIKLENQFKQPVVIANINKRRQQIKKGKCNAEREKQQDSDKENGSKEGEHLRHDFVEGPDMILSDLLLFPLFMCLVNHWTDSICRLQSCIPLTLHWAELLLQQPMIQDSLLLCGLPSSLPTAPAKSTHLNDDLTSLTTQTENLNIREAKIKKFKASPTDISQAMDKIDHISLDGLVTSHPCQNVKLPWKQLPETVHPKDGELPVKRLERKCEQLENLAQAVVALARPGHTVVDFCSGGGHLGILLAYLLPECKVILVENKEESIQRAERRIDNIGLKNITIYQCNLDYFKGHFDIGTCLHACGVATDLVLKTCLDNRASFVICPCCYGSIHNTHTVTYPRSQLVQQSGLSYKEYLCLGHGGDQTQFNIAVAKQGKQCMTLIDSDRAALAKEHGYEVTLTTLQPPECSPKNNLLIGTKMHKKCS